MNNLYKKAQEAKAQQKKSNNNSQVKEYKFYELRKKFEGMGYEVKGLVDNELNSYMVLRKGASIKIVNTSDKIALNEFIKLMDGENALFANVKRGDKQGIVMKYQEPEAPKVEANKYDFINRVKNPTMGMNR